MNRRGFLGMLAAGVGLRLKPDTFTGIDRATGPDYTAWISVDEWRALEDLPPPALIQISDELLRDCAIDLEPLFISEDIDSSMFEALERAPGARRAPIVLLRRT